MLRLSLRLIGSFQVTLNSQPVTGFQTNKARALLAYLAIEQRRPHSRSQLAGLFWPGYIEESARVSLRRALANIRLAVQDHQAQPSFLLIEKSEIQFNQESNYSLDVTQFSEAASLLLNQKVPLDNSDTLARLEQAASLYQGAFLDGLALDDCESFTAWLELNRQYFQRQALSIFHRLSDVYMHKGDFAQAQEYAWRQLAFDDCYEEAHRQLMHILMYTGDRGAALMQFERCRQRLSEELGVEPSKETVELYGQIRNQTFPSGQDAPAQSPTVVLPSSPTTPAVPPPFFNMSSTRSSVPTPVVARQQELAKLSALLDRVVSGQGQVALIIGDPGCGKTALAQEFARRAQDVFTDLVVTTGDCSAYTGIGDPYLPFCEILALLTGDVESRWAVGALSRLHAERLWSLAPYAVQAMLEVGPDLIDTFVLATPLMTRAAAAAPYGADWLIRLHELVQRKGTAADPAKPRQDQLLGQYIQVLQRLAQVQPLLLLLDDLQWADAGSINLLFALGRQLSKHRIMVVGIYRSTEVSLGRDGYRHPLEPVLNEFKRSFGDIEIDLVRVQDRAFIDDFLDTEPNRLDTTFREMLYQQTHGHPLFTVELLRGMQECGDLVRDSDGYWREGKTSDWNTLPARVEAVIGERIARLPERLRQLLKIASVEGELFTAEVLAHVISRSEGEVIQWLGGELDRQHRLVRAQAIYRLDHHRLSHYRFGHILFQRYVYQQLDPVERAYWHEAVGSALETLYSGHPDALAPIAGQLARHFEEAGIVPKAVIYLRSAGERALRLSANEEVIAYLNRALRLLPSLPDTPERQRLELDLRLLLGPALIANRGYSVPEVLENYEPAYRLAKQMGDAAQLCQALWGLRAYYHVRDEHQKAFEVGREFFALAEEMQATDLLVEAHRSRGTTLYHLGEFPAARMHLEKTLALYDMEQHRGQVYLYGHDTGVAGLSYLALTLWALGYPEQALQRTLQGVVLAQEVAHPFSVAYALCNVVFVSQNRQDLSRLNEYVERTLTLTTKQGFKFWTALATMISGWMFAKQGQIQKGIEQIQQGLALADAINSNWWKRYFLALLGDAYRMAGEVELGLKTLSAAIEGEGKTDEYSWEAELYRLKGELLFMRDAQSGFEPFAEAELCFQQALQMARRQQTKSLELRAAMSLGRLWQTRGRRDHARQLLAPIYDWFTEGFDTLDLQEAKVLLAQLSLT